MESVRIVDETPGAVTEPCCRCGRGQRPWDRIAGLPYCPDCQESLVQGEAAPLVARTRTAACAVCGRQGTVAYETHPRRGPGPLGMDLCAEHLRALLGRRLGPHAYHHLGRRLHGLGLAADDVFLLHGAFYDGMGRALRPAVEVAEG